MKSVHFSCTRLRCALNPLLGSRECVVSARRSVASPQTRAFNTLFYGGSTPKYMSATQTAMAAAAASVPLLPRPEVAAQIVAEAESRPVVLVGPMGAGKSVLLHEVTEHIASQKREEAFVLRIPSAKSMLSGKTPYVRVAGTAGSLNPPQAGEWDLPNESAILLSETLKANADFVDQRRNLENHVIGPMQIGLINSNVSKEISGCRKIAAGSLTLRDLMMQGRSDPAIATSVVFALIREMAHWGDGAVIAIDDINAAYGDTSYHDENSQILFGECFVLFDKISNIMLKRDAQVRVVAAATSRIFWGEAPRGYPEGVHMVKTAPFGVPEIEKLLVSMSKLGSLSYALNAKRIHVCTGGNPGRVIDMSLNPHL